MLSKLLENTPQTLLFIGPKEVIEVEADAFARKLLDTTKKNPPDLRTLYPEGKAYHHPMHAIKQFIEEAGLPPFEAKRKVFMIYEAERMLPSSSNALLKTLEEPLEAVTIILSTSHPEILLPTVFSRCFRVDFTKESTRKTDPELPEKMFHVGFRLLRGDLPTAKELPDGGDSEAALTYLYQFYRDLHLLREKGDPSLLFYSDKEEVLSRIDTPLPSLEELQKLFERARQAQELHLSLDRILPIFEHPKTTL